MFEAEWGAWPSGWAAAELRARIPAPLPTRLRAAGGAAIFRERDVPRSHIHRYRVAFVDCDPAQIVHFSNYFRWFDTASREFFTACGVPSWRDTERDCGIIGTPLVDAQASFRNPATYGEDLDIESWVDGTPKAS